MKFIEGVLLSLGFVLTLYLFFILLPASLYADNECLKKGYPKAHVTLTLDRYCSNLQGAVVVKVEKQ